MKKGDVLIILFCVLLCVFLFAKALLPQSDLKAYVWVGGELKKEISLSEIDEAFEEEFNGCVLSFSKDGVSFASSSCRDKLCVKHSSLSKSGDTMACVPNKVVLSIKNEKSEKEKIDAVAY